jgi:hypothetical protein
LVGARCSEEAAFGDFDDSDDWEDEVYVGIKVVT